MTSDSMQISDAAASYHTSVDAQDIPPGYKRTEVGLVPNDWEVLPLPDVCWFQEGPGVRTHQFTTTGVKLLNGTNISNGKVDLGNTTRFISIDEAEGIYKHFLVDDGDILLATSGVTIEKLHEKVAFARASLLPLCMNTSTVRFKAREGRLLDKILYFLLQSDVFREQIARQATGSAQLNFGPSHLRKAFLPVASPLEEQRAIAEALSDVDGLLGTLEALIAKKRAIKQAAMQRLLTGKTRLPGSSGEWETKRLGEVAEIESGATPNTHVPANWDGDIPWCTPTDITGTPGKYLVSTERRITRNGLANCAAKLLPRGALLLCSRATVGELKIATTAICTNQGFKSLVCKRGTSNEFLYYLLLTLKPALIERSSGSTFLEIGKRDVASLQALFPIEEEQTAIATVLSDMDAEIGALEARRDKTRQIKQGMMQQLLTGRIRLVPPAEVPPC